MEMKENKRRKVSFSDIMLIGLIIVMGIGFFMSMSYIDNLENQILERDNLIRKLTFSDDLVKEYFDIKKDTTNNNIIYTLKDSKKTRIVETVTKTTEPTFVQGDKILTLQELLDDYNKTYNEYTKLQNNFQELDYRYRSLIKQNKDIIKKYNEFVVSFYSILNEKTAMEDALHIIRNSYGISYKIKTDSLNSHISIDKSEQIDSALMLLPYYRDRIEYNAFDNSWTVRLPRKGESVNIKTIIDTIRIDNPILKNTQSTIIEVPLLINK